MSMEGFAILGLLGYAAVKATSAGVSLGAKAVTAGTKMARNQIRKSIENRQISETTRQYLDRYEATLTDMRAQGLDQYVRSQFNLVQSRLSEAKRLVSSDPHRSQELSRSIGMEIASLPRQARDIRTDQQIAERMDQQRRQREEAAKRQREWDRQRDQQRRQAAQAQREENERFRQLQQETQQLRQELERQREAQRLERLQARNEALARQKELELAQAQRLQEQRELQLAQEHAQMEKRIQEAQEAEQRRRLRFEFVNAIPATIAAVIDDPVEADAVYDQWAQLQARYEKLGEQSDADVSELKSALDRDVAALKEEAVRQANLWREKNRQKNLTEDTVEQLRVDRDILAESTKQTASAELKTLIASLDSLQSDITAGLIQPQQAQEALESVRSETQQSLVDEQLRKESIRALVKTIRAKGFDINPPILNGDVVELVGKRPNGERCRFEVKLDGGFHYRFDQYDGSACKKDIAEVQQMLEQVYGLVLSDERIVWENPDRLDRDSIDRPATENHVESGSGEPAP